MSSFESPTGEPPTGVDYSGFAPHRGTLILVLGILSIVLCQILGPFAWIMGKGDMAKINAGQMEPEGKGITQAGMICGIIGTVLLGLSVVFILLYLLLMVVLLGGAAAAGAGAGP